VRDLVPNGAAPPVTKKGPVFTGPFEACGHCPREEKMSEEFRQPLIGPRSNQLKPIEGLAAYYTGRRLL
jgi:hypothetical protein